MAKIHTKKTRMEQCAETFSRGKAAEAQAKTLLEHAGYRIIAERYRNAAGEIDLIAQAGDTLVCVEVKARKTLEEGLYAINPRQQKRIMRCAEGFLAAYPQHAHMSLRFDVVIIPGKGLPIHLKHAFMAE